MMSFEVDFQSWGQKKSHVYSSRENKEAEVFSYGRSTVPNSVCIKGCRLSVNVKVVINEKTCFLIKPSKKSVTGTLSPQLKHDENSLARGEANSYNLLRSLGNKPDRAT